jgi:subtilisin family serine protease
VTDPAAASGPSAYEDPFVRYEARILDPATAVRLPGGTAPTSTIYRGDALLVTASSRAAARALIAAVERLADGLDLRLLGPDVFEEIDEARDAGQPAADQGDDRRERRRLDRRARQAHNRLARLLALAEQSGIPLVVPVRFGSSLAGPAPAVDVWPLLQAVRASGDEEMLHQVGLDHLMFCAASISGTPFTRGMSILGNPFTRGMANLSGNPFTRGMASGVDGYLQGGSGGHGPVSVVLAPPQPRSQDCRPHVVVLDTGVGEHPWFRASPVERRLLLDNGDPIGLDIDDPAVAATDPDGEGAVPDPLTGLLDSHAGHGTFIAGLLRQSCPDARITALRLMDGDGVVAEDELTAAVTALAVHLDQHPGVLDALVLSLGYYVESDDDVHYTAGLEQLLLDLASRGVITFAAAGNDCTDRRSYPAAFADHPQFNAAGALPLLAVAALNPDRSVALFSNDAAWVNGEAAGANVVSTAPVLASGAWSADTSFAGPNGERRGTIDPDQFSGGFATWSGTSFAAPVLAGRFLANLVAAGCPTDVTERAALVPPRPSRGEERQP